MTFPDTNGEVDEKRFLEERPLRIGYFAMLTERHPFNDDVTQCMNPESAYFLALEREHMHIPDDLSFDALEGDIQVKHRERMRRIWYKVQERHRDWRMIAATLQRKWSDNEIPEVSDDEAHSLIRSAPVKIREDLRPAILALISRPPKSDSDSQFSPLEYWKQEERGLRDRFYKADKNYITAIRLYYEMLLEKPDEGKRDTEEWVLPSDHPQRQAIVIKNRYLRLIDITHQALSIAKTIHHEQAKKRLRKTESVPYVFHPMNAVGGFIVDVVPHTIEETRLQFNVLLGSLIAALHDTRDDSKLDIKDIMNNYVRRLADQYDSRIDQTIESGYPDRRRVSVKRKVLDLVGSHMYGAIPPILRVLSDSTELDEREKRQAVAQHVVPPEKALELLEIETPKNRSPGQFMGGLLRKWGILKKGIEENRTQNASRTFTLFPVSYERKLDLFLLRLHGITTRDRRQQAFIAKLEDRAHNVSTLKGRYSLDQRITLRGTITRLIAWGMLDHDLENFPLYNALPRLIDVTVQEYKRFANENPEAMEDCDREYLQQLLTWQLEVRRYQVSTQISEVLERWNEKNTALSSPETEAVS